MQTCHPLLLVRALNGYGSLNRQDYAETLSRRLAQPLTILPLNLRNDIHISAVNKSF